MNILSKILIVLVFIMAVLASAFMAYSFRASNNSQFTAEQFKIELDIARKNNQTLIETNAALHAQNTAIKADNLAKDQTIVQNQLKWDAQEAELRLAYKNSEDRGKLAELNFEKALAAQERMKKEVEGLKRIIEDREDRNIKLHAKYKDSQDLNISLDRDLKFSQERNQILIARVQELERHIAELVSPSKGDTVGALAKDPSSPNPPQKFIKGVIERVDSTDKTLVRLSLGTDHGIRKENTLEVYRLSPNAEYIGMIRIEDAHHHTSVGRLIRTPGVPPRAVREGDVVSSTLNPR